MISGSNFRSCIWRGQYENSFIYTGVSDILSPILALNLDGILFFSFVTNEFLMSLVLFYWWLVRVISCFEEYQILNTPRFCFRVIFFLKFPSLLGPLLKFHTSFGWLWIYLPARLYRVYSIINKIAIMNK